jgi:hypothetical protein
LQQRKTISSLKKKHNKSITKPRGGKALITQAQQRAQHGKQSQQQRKSKMAKINLSEGEGSSITKLPKSTYQAVISAAWDLGMQEGTYEGVTTIKHKIMFRFEVNKLIEDEGAFNGKRYNLLKEINVPDFFGDKALLVKLASSAFGREMSKEDFTEFDTDSLIGKNLMIATGFTGGGNPKIESFSTLMDILPPIAPELDSKMPEWVEKKANAQATPPAQAGSQAPANNGFSAPPAPESDLPF